MENGGRGATGKSRNSHRWAPLLQKVATKNASGGWQNFQNGDLYQKNTQKFRDEKRSALLFFTFVFHYPRKISAFPK